MGVEGCRLTPVDDGQGPGAISGIPVAGQEQCDWNHQKSACGILHFAYLSGTVGTANRTVFERRPPGIFIGL
jgi:hypothetical protein